jgi:uncharacterized beta-barrel protein YwiB (DUF1934 family)
MITVKKGEKKAVTLTVKTLIIDPEELSGAPAELARLIKSILEDEASADDLGELIDEESRSEMELCTEAILRINAQDCIEIEYPENLDDEQMRTTSKIIFHPESPELVSMIKEGAINAYLSFEAGKTHVCTYNTPFMPFKIYVESRAVENRLLDLGVLHLNYVLNFADNPPQHFILDVEILQA